MRVHCLRTALACLILSAAGFSAASGEIYLGLRSERTLGDGHAFGSFAGDWQRVILDISTQSFARALSEAELVAAHGSLEAAYSTALANSEAARATLETAETDDGVTQLIATPPEAVGGLLVLDGFVEQVAAQLGAEQLLIGQPASYGMLVTPFGSDAADPTPFAALTDQYARTLQGSLDNHVLTYNGSTFASATAATYPLTAKEILMSLGPDPENTLVITLKDGDVVIRLRDDVAPNHAARIKQLAREGFYDGIVFHRVIEGFMAQTGDPTGTGTSGSGQNLNAEFSDTPFLRGTVGMARAASPNSADSQFFIMFAEGRFLDNNYTVIGQVESGMEFVDQIQRGEPPANPDQMVQVRVQADL